MKVKLYCDLPNDYIADEDLVYTSGSKTLGKSYTRYVFEVDLPIEHFRHQADRKIEAVMLGKEEE